MRLLSGLRVTLPGSVTTVVLTAVLATGCAAPPVASGHAGGPPPGTAAAAVIQKLNAQHGSVRQPGGWKR